MTDEEKATLESITAYAPPILTEADLAGQLGIEGASLEARIYRGIPTPDREGRVPFNRQMWAFVDDADERQPWMSRGTSCLYLSATLGGKAVRGICVPLPDAMLENGAYDIWRDYIVPVVAPILRKELGVE